jgi:protein-L-isoaspartate(D-aspartate) O-methyltransferase
MTASADPRHIYLHVIVAIDEGRRLNNGQPSLWPYLYDRIRLTPGTHVVHIAPVNRTGFVGGSNC